ncbi:hypothetical protein OIU74_017343, partial [Salix koriyanagi]
MEMVVMMMIKMTHYLMSSMVIQKLRQTGGFLASEYLIKGAWNLLAVGTAKGMEFWPKRSLIVGFINIYKFVDDGKSLKLLDKTNVPRWLTSSYHVDSDTMAGAEKFGNVYFVRLPQDVSDEIEEDPTGGKISGSREMDMATLMSPGGSNHSSPTRKPPFPTSTPSALPIVELQS